VTGAWSKLGLRGRLALSIAAIVTGAFAIVFVAVRAEMAHESQVIEREEAQGSRDSSSSEGMRAADAGTSPIAEAQSDAEKALVVAGGAALVAALLAGYLLAARTASPLRRFAATAAKVDGGDLSPRLEADPASATELRVLAEAFNGMLDRLDRAFARQRQFVSDASHELRSPLTAIRGQLEVLARSETPSAAEVRRVEAIAMTEMGRVERLVEDLLALAQLDEGVGPSLHRVPADSFLRGLAGAPPKDTELGEMAGGSIEIDPDLIAQVVRNLLANAHRHAAPNGQVVLSSKDDGNGLVVSVDDDGPGVPTAERERVFDRFHRNEPARDRTSGGSGLGLAIARSIIALHGGRIWIEDSPLGGARVSFALPGWRSDGERSLT
jgi:two-component system OmpR family sensor kinase